MELHMGDCLEVMRDIPENSVDIIIADLPYGRFAHLEWDRCIDLERMWEHLWRIAKPTTPIFLFGDFRFANILMNSQPRHFKFEIVWNKGVTTTPLLSHKRPGKATEYILAFYKKQPVYNILKYHKKIVDKTQDARVAKTKGYEYKDDPIMKGRNYNGKAGKQYEPTLPINYVKTPMVMGQETDMVHAKSAVFSPTLPINVINCKTKRLKKVLKSLTEKPQDILEMLLKYYSNEGDVCLDFTMGSGSMGVACKTLNRRFIGIEMNEEHFTVAERRLL